MKEFNNTLLTEGGSIGFKLSSNLLATYAKNLGKTLHN